MQSVMRQTYQGAIECILVDDCGTDKSIVVAEQLIKDYHGPIEFHILHHDHNRGLSAARNTGTDAATGDYIYYLDSDDYISDDCLEVLTEPLKEREYDMVLGDIQTFGEKQGLPFLYEERSEILGNADIFDSYANRLIYVMAWNKLCKLSFLRNNNISFLEGQLHEDELWTYKIMLCIQSIGISHELVYYYRVRSNSIATDTTNAKKKLASYFETVQYIQIHPYTLEDDYHKCLMYYWNLYLSIALKNKIKFKSAYVQLREKCPYKPNKMLLKGRITLKQYKAKLHFALPHLLGYIYICIRNFKNSVL